MILGLCAYDVQACWHVGNTEHSWPLFRVRVARGSKTAKNHINYSNKRQINSMTAILRTAFGLASRRAATTTTAAILTPGIATTTSQSLLRRLLSDAPVAAATKEQIAELLKKDKVVVFMKGVPDAPRCGFSNAVVQILRMHGVQYGSHNVLENEAIRQGVKDFSDWPTIPQIFINGEFVGGCDILLQLHQNGELIEELKKVNIRSALLDAEEKPAGDDAKK